MKCLSSRLQIKLSNLEKHLKLMLQLHVARRGFNSEREVAAKSKSSSLSEREGDS